MSDDPMFVYAAVYADRAHDDYDTLLNLHSADLVGSYDAALGSSFRRRSSVRRSSAPLRAVGSGMPWVASRAVTPRGSVSSSTRVRPRWP
jgi:hypothetical protein